MPGHKNTSKPTHTHILRVRASFNNNLHSECVYVWAADAGFARIIYEKPLSRCLRVTLVRVCVYTKQWDSNRHHSGYRIRLSFLPRSHRRFAHISSPVVHIMCILSTSKRLVVVIAIGDMDILLHHAVNMQVPGHRHSPVGLGSSKWSSRERFWINTSIFREVRLEQNGK